MRIECIAIGSELLTSPRVDTNSIWLEERLARLGLGLARKTAVGDDPTELRALFREALGRSELILCTGGLGPTFDDLTKELWAEALGVDLVEDAPSREAIAAFHAARGREVPPTNWKQALHPRGSEPLRNPLGTAPGVWWETPAGPRVVLMPGVPKEMEGMWAQEVEPRLAPFAGRPLLTLRAVVGGLPESVLGERTQALRERHRQLDWTILAPKTHLELLARATDAAALEAARLELEAELGPDLVRWGEGGVEDTLLETLRARGEDLALAESMSAGLAASRLAALPGCSAILRGGAVVYSPGAKEALAGVDPGLMAREGTVSRAVTLALARGIRRRLGSTWSLAITGNAGPTQDPHGAAPLGTTHLAVDGPGGTSHQEILLPGDRGDVQVRGASWGLDHLRRRVMGVWTGGMAD